MPREMSRQLRTRPSYALLVGLLVFNIFLGPIAIALASVALYRNTTRPGRAHLGLGLGLGLADLLVLAAFMSADNTMSWSLGG